MGDTFVFLIDQRLAGNLSHVRYRENLATYAQIGPVHCFDHVEAVSKLPSGISKIRYGAGHLYIAFVDKGAEQTVVSFHAAVGTDGVTKPVFTGVNMLDQLDVNGIFVSDPILDFGLNLGWFAGDLNRSLQIDLTALLERHFAHRDGEVAKLFFGASGGGFAALFFGAQFPSSLVMCVNPQTNINRYWPPAVESYRDAAWNGKPLESMPVEFDLTKTYSKEIDTTVLYLQNLGDTSHVKHHLVPFLNEAALPNRQFGLVLGEWGAGHRAPSRAILDHFLSGAVGSKGEWINLTFSREVENGVAASEVLRRSTAYSSVLSSTDN